MNNAENWQMFAKCLLLLLLCVCVWGVGVGVCVCVFDPPRILFHFQMYLYVFACTV